MMGRRRTTNKHLPPRMVFNHGAFYHSATVRVEGKARKRWVLLSRDYAEALRLWAEIEGRAAGAPRTVTDLLNAYVTAMHGRLAAETLRGYLSSIKRLARVFGHMAPEDLKRSHVFAYLHQAGNVAANRDRALLSAAYNYARNMGYEGPNPGQGLHRRNPERPRKRYVEDAELSKLIDAATPEFARVLRFAYLTGMAEGDICTLLLSSADDVGIRYVRKKTGAETVIAWSDELRALWRAAAGDRIGAVPAFLSPKHSERRGYTPNGIRAAFKRVREAAGVEDVRFHDLRRKAGSDVAEEHAQRLLAHANPAVTRRHYRAKLVPVKPVK